MEIRQLTAKEGEEIRRITYRGYPALRDFSPEGMEKYMKDLLEKLVDQRGIRFFGAFQGEKLLGVMRIFSMTMNLYDRVIPVTGLGFLAVDPEARGQGVGKKLVEFFEEDGRNQNITLGVLLPFRFDYYGKFGYGYLNRRSRFHVKLSSLPQQGTQKVTVVDADQIIDIHRSLVPEIHGMTDLLPDEIKALKEDRESMFIAASDGRHYTAYGKAKILPLVPGNYTRNRIVVSHLYGSDPQGIISLFSFLRKQKDQCEELVWDTPLENGDLLFSNPEHQDHLYMDYGYLKTAETYRGLMGKILLRREFIDRFPGLKELHSFLWTTQQDVSGKARKGEFTLDERFLAPLWTGSLLPGELYQMGLLEGTEDSVKKLEGILSTKRILQSNSDF